MKNKKKFSIICENRREFLDCQKLLFKIGYFWNTIDETIIDNEIKDFCIDREFPVAILINFKMNNDRFIYDKLYTTEKITDPFYTENISFKYKHFSRKYKLKRLTRNYET